MARIFVAVVVPGANPERIKPIANTNYTRKVWGIWSKKVVGWIRRFSTVWANWPDKWNVGIGWGIDVKGNTICWRPYFRPPVLKEVRCKSLLIIYALKKSVKDGIFTKWSWKRILVRKKLMHFFLTFVCTRSFNEVTFFRDNVPLKTYSTAKDRSSYFYCYKKKCLQLLSKIIAQEDQFKMWTTWFCSDISHL